MANCKAGNTCRFTATEEVFQQIDTTTVEMTTQMNYFNESYDYSKDFEVSIALTLDRPYVIYGSFKNDFVGTYHFLD